MINCGRAFIGCFYRGRFQRVEALFLGISGRPLLDYLLVKVASFNRPEIISQALCDLVSILHHYQLCFSQHHVAPNVAVAYNANNAFVGFAGIGHRFHYFRQAYNQFAVFEVHPAYPVAFQLPPYPLLQRSMIGHDFQRVRVVGVPLAQISLFLLKRVEYLD